ncbi:MAG TPA: heparan-alpha-glucosaminide N-acetyltransferase domain-containing protein, partial [Candidatus Angelobacter sp.]
CYDFGDDKSSGIPSDHVESAEQKDFPMVKTATPALSRPAPAQAARADRNETPGSGRVQSIDIVRGAVMLLMAIDHVRVYSGLPAGGPTPGIFLTRWITHFVAPAFIFLAGTAAFLHGRKLGDTGSLARFLVTRGLWLVLLELTVLRVAWTFNFDFGHYLLAGVIWVIGWCMVLLAGLIFLPITNAGCLWPGRGIRTQFSTTFRRACTQ